MVSAVLNVKGYQCIESFIIVDLFAVKVDLPALIIGNGGQNGGALGRGGDFSGEMRLLIFGIDQIVALGKRGDIFGGKVVISYF